MLIKINSSSIFKEGNHVFGNVYFEGKECVFPDKDWNDFIIIIVNWWSLALKKLLKNGTLSEELLFMDGPFSVKINYLEEDYFDLFFFEQDKISGTSKVKIYYFINEFLKEVNSLIRHIDSFKWDSNEIRDLKINYTDLKNALEKTRNE